MDRISQMALFVRIVESGSFIRAAQELGLGRSTATATIQQLEKALSVRLLTRTTRHVSPTPEGEAFYQRASAVLAQVDDAWGAFREEKPRGHLRIEAPGILTRNFLIPQLSSFLARNPDLTVQFGQTDRLIDLVREGFDCAIRVGELNDSSLFYRKLGEMSEVTCASRAYFDARGVPASIDALAGHAMVGFVSSRTGRVIPLEFVRDGKVETRLLPASVVADSSDTCADLARAGFGLIQAPRYRFSSELASGSLIEVFADTPSTPLPINVVFPHKQQMSRRLAVFLDWLKEVSWPR